MPEFTPRKNLIPVLCVARIPRNALVFAVALVVDFWLMQSCLHAQMPDSTSPLEFHRVFLPHEMILQVDDHLPMDRHEFQEKIDKINLRSLFPRHPFLRAAKYSARYVDGELVGGRATWNIVIPDKTASLMSLEKMNLAIASARWLDSNEPAQIGGGDQGTILVISDRVAADGAGTLEFHWTMGGTKDAMGTVEFDLELRRSLTTEFSISTSESVEISADEGLVKPPTIRRDKNAAKNGMSTETTSIWQVSLGGHHSLKLIVTPQRTQMRSLVMYRQETDYSVSLAGNEIDSRLQIQKSVEPLRRISLEAHSSVQIRSIHWNDTPLSWRSVPALHVDTQLVTVIIPPLPTPGENVLRITATAPIELDRLTPVPSLVPSQMSWQGGTSRVTVGKDLRLQNYEFTQARQTVNRGPVAPTLTLQNHSPQASVWLHLAPRTSPVRIATGVTASISDESISTESVVEVRQHPPIWFRLVADVGPDWTIEDVSSVESDLISDWEIRSDHGERLLDIQFRPPPQATVAPRFRIHATRKLNDQVATLAHSDVTPFRFRDVEHDVDVRSLRSVGGLRLDLVGHDAFDGVAADALAEAGRGLVDVLTGDLVYSHQDSRIQIRLQKAESQFVADCSVALRVGEGRCSEEFVIEWTPQDSHLDQVLVHLSEARNEAPHWSFVEPAARSLVSRRLAQDEQQRAGLGTTGETWLFVMQDLGTDPRTIRGYRDFSQADEMPVIPSLVMVPDARAQRAIVTLENNSTAHYEIETTEGVEATLVPGRAATLHSTIGSYRYRPERHAIGGANAIQLVRIDESMTDVTQGKPNCWAWNAILDSHFSPDGTAQHRFTYRLENHGRRWIGIRPTESLTIRRIAVGSSVVVPNEDQSESIRVDLPQDKLDVVMVVDASAEHPPWGLGHRLRAEFISVDIPVVHAQWTVWLPDDYQPVFLGQRLRRESPPWTQQLFGRFGRHARRLGSWATMLQLNDAVRRNPNRTLQALHSELEQQAEQHLEFGQPITWGQVMVAAADELPSTTILVDRIALAAAGISAATSMDYAPAENSIADVLQAAGIVFLQDAQRLIVTTNRKRGLYNDDFVPTHWPDVFRLRQGPLCRQTHDVSRFPSAATWHASVHPYEKDLWDTVPRIPLASERHLAAWHITVHPDADGSIQGHVIVLKTQCSQVLGWLGFLISFAVSWRARNWVPCVAIVTVAIGVVLTLAIPAAQPAAWGLLAGLPVGFLIRQWQKSEAWVRDAQMRSDSTVVRSTYRPYSSLSLPVWVLVFVFAFSLVAVAQTIDSSHRSASVSPGSHRVLIPVDENQEPDGDTLFLPRDFYHQLLRLESDESTPPTIIRSAAYRARLAAANGLDRPNGRIQLVGFAATYEIETRQSNALVRIPLHPNLLAFGQSTIKLDERPVQPIWMPVDKGGDDNGPQRAANPAFVRVALPGTHRLELSLKVSAVVGSDDSRFQLRIPRIHDSTLTVEATRHVNLSVPSSLGTCERSENGPLICKLGPTDQLVVEWPIEDAQDQTGEMSARLLSLLDIHPAQAFLTTQIHVEPSGEVEDDSPRTVDLIFDESVQWLPTDSPSIRLVEHREPEKRRLRIDLNEEGKAKSPIRFLLRSPAESRDVRLPTTAWERVRAVEHWLGISLDDSLSADYPSHAESLAPSVFRDAWRQETTSLNAAFQVPIDDDEPWAVNVQPNEMETASDETLDLHFKARETLVRYEGQITATGQGNFKHQLRTPKDLGVTQVEVVQGEQRIDMTWTQHEAATFVFLDQPLTGPYTLTLFGRLPTAASDQHDIPLVWLRDAKTTNLNVRLFRAPNTQLRFVDHPGFRMTQDSESLDEPSQSWRVADLQTNRPSDARATIELIVEVPTIAGQLVTTVVRDGAGWIATADLKCDVIAGTVDHLTIDMPNSWRKTLSVSPSLSHQMVDAGGGHRKLRVWLHEPIVGSNHLVIRGEMDTSDVITVPELRPLNVEPLESFVRIPTTNRNDQFTWSTSRLLAAAVPENFTAPPSDTEFTTYRAASRFRAELIAIKPRENLPHISLCEVHHVIGRHVDYGVATFYLEPSGLPTTVLTMPPGGVLMDASVGGVSAQRTQVAENQWRVALGATRLPHRMRVAYRLPHQLRLDGTWNLQSPTLQLSENLNARTLWTISTMDDVAQNNTLANAGSMTSVDYAITKVTALRHLFNAPDVTSVDYSDPEAIAWYAHWNDYIRDHITYTRELIKHSSTSLTAAEQSLVDQTIAEMEHELQQVETQLGVVSTETASDELGPSARLMIEPRRPPLTTHFGSQTSHFATGLGVSTVQIRSTGTGDFDRMMRFVSAIAMVVVGVALGFGGRPADWEIWLQHRKGILLLFLSVLWWFALYPRWFAVIIAMMGIWLWFWPENSGDSHHRGGSHIKA